MNTNVLFECSCRHAIVADKILNISIKEKKETSENIGIQSIFTIFLGIINRFSFSLWTERSIFRDKMNFVHKQINDYISHVYGAIQQQTHWVSSCQSWIHVVHTTDRQISLCFPIIPYFRDAMLNFKLINN